MAADTSGDIVLCEPAQSKCTWTHYDTSQKPFCAVIYSENAGPISRDTRFVRACAIEMHMDITKAILHGSLQGKCRTRIPRHPFCASLPNRNAHGHVTRGILCRNSQGKCRTLPIPPRSNTGPYNTSVWTLYLEDIDFGFKTSQISEAIS